MHKEIVEFCLVREYNFDSLDEKHSYKTTCIIACSKNLNVHYIFFI